MAAMRAEVRGLEAKLSESDDDNEAEGAEILQNVKRDRDADAAKMYQEFIKRARGQ